MRKFIRLNVLTVFNITLLSTLLTLTVYAIQRTNNITGELKYSVIEEKQYEELYREQQQCLNGSVFGESYYTEISEELKTRVVQRELQVQEEIARKREMEQYYMENLILEHGKEENLQMPQELQQYVWELSKELDLDYFLVMGIIARESRFVGDVIGYSNGVYYYGYMQISGRYYRDIQEAVGLGEEDIDIKNPKDNIRLGMHYLRYCIDETGSEYNGLYAYGIGMGAYKEAIAVGKTRDALVDKAYKYRGMLYECVGVKHDS